ncbi:MAG: hypothetical protein GXP04_06765 [Alphaproteobacteria bacterium]|nr:hypothetical protein [Alphaproteobacteria bacterium]
MKPNWMAMICGVVMVAACFSVSFMKGADAAMRDAAKANHTNIALTQ